MTSDLLWAHLQALPYFRGLLRAVEARLMQGLDLPPPTLDVGSGDGHFASVAFDRPLEVGVDPSLSASREAQARRCYLSLVQADGAILPHATGSFSSALSNSVLEHVDRLDEVLAEIARVLRPGAPFVFTVPNPGYRAELGLPKALRRLGLPALGRAYADWFMRMSRTVNLLGEQAWIEKLNRAGFVLERWERYFSPAALRVLEWGHYFGSPTLLARALSGRWILAPTRWSLWLTEKAVRRYYQEPGGEDGTYTFFLARRL